MGATEAPELSSGRLLPVPPPAPLPGRRRARHRPLPSPAPRASHGPALTRPGWALPGPRLRPAPPVPAAPAAPLTAANGGPGATGAEAAGASGQGTAHSAPPVPTGSAAPQEAKRAEKLIRLEKQNGGPERERASNVEFKKIKSMQVNELKPKDTKQNRKKQNKTTKKQHRKTTFRRFCCRLSPAAYPLQAVRSAAGPVTAVEAPPAEPSPRHRRNTSFICACRNQSAAQTPSRTLRDVPTLPADGKHLWFLLTICLNRRRLCIPAALAIPW
ncbi:uncharacterized protein LOC141731067 [Zonotrichia albicollis]|uniref:uncharacterized protein LOC141731067 n=1 Tax=Zonotrichia albicollis TaxID=44394 RepID=UPI003D8120C6